MEKDENRKQTIADFKHLVNMTPTALRKWLETDESQSVGQDSGDGTSIGSKSGHRILEIKAKKVADYSEADLQHMHRVISYISRHLAQGPTKEEIKTSPWRYSLMNWGHDPLKDKGATRQNARTSHTNSGAKPARAKRSPAAGKSRKAAS